MSIDTQLIEDLIGERCKAERVVFRGGAPIDDPFNEVSKADPPDYAWYVLADVTTVEDGQEETDAMSFQIGEKDGKLDIYCTWDYDIFKSEGDCTE
jgi:hypothetical protein